MMSTLRDIAVAAGTVAGAQSWQATRNIGGVANVVDIGVQRPVTFVVAHTDEKNSGEVLAAVTRHIGTFDPIRVLVLLDLLAALAGDHCEAHAELEPTCVTCAAVLMLTEERGSA